MNHSYYRPEIDGLRCIAVLAVIIFHAEFSWNGDVLLSGGYIGVDVFFVISGYLITSIISREIAGTGFDLRRFYERRVRRIIPPLLTVVLVSMPFAWFYLLPSALQAYSGSILATLGFGSNFWFWLEDSYVAEASLLKPFLHTWSLSVEEQFYLAYPLLLILLTKYFSKYVMVMLVVLLLVSLQVAQSTSATSPDAAFYLLPARGWELLVGALIARLELSSEGSTTEGVVAKLMPALGLLLVAAGIFLFDTETQHPSYLTIMPVLGTGIVIWFCRDKGSVSYLLSSRPMVSIGLISYSFYLWHFPIFAIFRITLGTLTNFDKLLLIGLAFILSVATYFLVEKPMRNRSVFPVNRLLGILVPVYVAVAGIQYYLYVTKGAEYRMDDVASFSEFKEVEFRRLKGETTGIMYRSQEPQLMCNLREPESACEFKNGAFVTLGDSYVGQYETATLRILEDTSDGLLSLNYEQCPFVDGDLWFGDTPECPIINQKRWEKILGFEDKKIFFVSANSMYFAIGKRTDGEAPTKPEVIQAYHRNILKLIELGHKVVLISGAPDPDENIIAAWKLEIANATSLVNYSGSGDVFTDDDVPYIRAKSWEKDVFNIADENLIKVSVPDILCAGESRRCLNVVSDGSLYNLSSHLSIIGAERIVQRIVTDLKARNWLSMEKGQP